MGLKVVFADKCTVGADIDDPSADTWVVNVDKVFASADKLRVCADSAHLNTDRRLFPVKQSLNHLNVKRIRILKR